MKKKFFKKGVEGPSWTIVVWIILIVLLVIVLMFIFGFFRPNLSKLGDYANSVFHGLQKIDLFGNVEDNSNAVSEKSPEELLKDAKICGDYKKINPLKIEDVNNKDKLNSELFKCYISENDCEKAKDIFDKQQINSDIIKSSKTLELIQCYSLKGVNKDTEPVKTLLGELSKEDKAKANQLLEDIDSIKKNLEDYKQAVDVVVSSSATQENKDEAKKILNILKLHLNKITLKNSLQNELLEATKFWLQKMETSDCGFKEDIDKKLKFPISGISGAHDGDEIKVWSIYENLKCTLNKLSGGMNEDTNTKVIYFLNKYGDENKYDSLVDEIIKDYNAPAKCNILDYNIEQSFFSNLFSNQEGCNKFNNDLEVKQVGFDRYKKMKCQFIDPGVFASGRCSSCSNVNKCTEYSYADTCEANPCGIEGRCKDIGRVFLNCVPIAAK